MKGRIVWSLNQVDIRENGDMSIQLLRLYSNRQMAEKECAFTNKRHTFNAVARCYPKLQHKFDGYARKDKTKKATWFYVGMETIR